MRLATVRLNGSSQFAFATDRQNAHEYFLWADYAQKFSNDKIVSQTKTFLDFVKRNDVLIPHLKQNEKVLSELKAHRINAGDYLLPFTPVTFRDFYCFEEHVMTARKGRGLEMIPEWYQAPIFYYSNHLSFRGPFEDIPYPKDSNEVDCELEIACVIGKEVRNADLEEARKAILGYALINDWTARDFQRFEMKVNMGPTKGKDFATSFGSYIVTADELESKRTPKGFDVEIELKINGESFTRKNWKDIQFSFEEMLVRASKNCTIYPGEVFGSGTMGGGCLLEHNIVKSTQRWLKMGDTVTMQWLPGGPEISNKIGEPK